MAEFDFKRRFGGVARLYGEAGLAKLQAAHVVVVGVGGVGSWAVEALARNAVGQLTIIDLDNIAESNVNRQIHALEGDFGHAKVHAMAARIARINPSAKVITIEDFIEKENVAKVLSGLSAKQPDIILDCTDDAKAKIALGAYCKQNKITLMMSGGAGGRLDPTCIEIEDLSLVRDDKLLAKVRKQLRVHHGFPRGTPLRPSSTFNITCVYSTESMKLPSEVCAIDQESITGLNCEGYGSSVNVTAPFGFALAGIAVNAIVK